MHLLSLNQSTELSAWRLFFFLVAFCSLLVDYYFLCLSSSFPPVARLGKILLRVILSLVLSLPFSDGKFGAYMQVHIQNDGPVTIELESPAAAVDPKQVSKPVRLCQKRMFRLCLHLRGVHLPLCGTDMWEHCIVREKHSCYEAAQLPLGMRILCFPCSLWKVK